VLSIPQEAIKELAATLLQAALNAAAATSSPSDASSTAAAHAASPFTPSPAAADSGSHASHGVESEPTIRADILRSSEMEMQQLLQCHRLMRDEWERLAAQIHSMVNNMQSMTISDGGSAQLRDDCHLLDVVQLLTQRKLQPFFFSIRHLYDEASKQDIDGTNRECIEHLSRPGVPEAVRQHFRQRHAVWCSGMESMDKIVTEAIAAMQSLVHTETKLRERIYHGFQRHPDAQVLSAEENHMFQASTKLPAHAEQLLQTLYVMQVQRLGGRASTQRNTDTAASAQDAGVPAQTVHLSASTVNGDNRALLIELRELQSERARVLTAVETTQNVQLHISELLNIAPRDQAAGLAQLDSLALFYVNTVSCMRKHVKPLVNKLQALLDRVQLSDETVTNMLEFVKASGARLEEDVDQSSARQVQLRYVDCIDTLFTALQSVQALERRVVECIRERLVRNPSFEMTEPTHNVHIRLGLHIRKEAHEVLTQLQLLHSRCRKLRFTAAEHAAADSIGAASAASAASAARMTPTVLVDTSTRFASALLRLKTEASSAAAYSQALATLHNVLNNVLLHPFEAKYRSLRTSNAALRSKLITWAGGLDALLAAGFSKEMKSTPSAPSPSPPPAAAAPPTAAAPASTSAGDRVESLDASTPATTTTAAGSGSGSHSEEEYLVLSPSGSAWDHLQTCMRTLACFRRAAGDVGLAFLGASSLQLYSARQRAEVIRLHLDKFSEHEKARQELAESAQNAAREYAGYAFIPPGRIGMVGRGGATPSDIRGLCTSGLMTHPNNAVLLVSLRDLGITALVHIQHDTDLTTIAYMLKQYVTMTGAAGNTPARILVSPGEEGKKVAQNIIDVVGKACQGFPSARQESSSSNGTDSATVSLAESWLVMQVTCDAVVVDVEEYSGVPDMYGSDSELHLRLPVVHHPSEPLMVVVSELHRALPLHMTFSTSGSCYSVFRFSPPADNDAVLSPAAVRFLREELQLLNSDGRLVEQPLLSQFHCWRAAFLAGKLRNGHGLEPVRELTSEQELDRLAARQTIALVRYTLLQRPEADRPTAADRLFTNSMYHLLEQWEAGNTSLLPQPSAAAAAAATHSIAQPSSDGAARGLLQSLRQAVSSSSGNARRTVVKKVLLGSNIESRGLDVLFQLHWHVMLALEAALPDAAGSYAINHLWL